jgi:hypothetical protein
MRTTAADDAVLVEPLAPAVGLEVRGVTPDALNDEQTAMLRDLWQIGGALLFRNCERPGRCAALLGRVLGGDILTTVSATIPGSTEWAMVGADASAPLPLACVIATDSGDLPALSLAGMEAAIDSLRLTGSDMLSEAEHLHFAHSLDGPMLPVLLHHPLSGVTVLYPPPRRAAGKDSAALALVRMAEEPQFCYRHVWQPGDVLAWDPRAVRSKWELTPAEDSAVFSIVRASSASQLPANAPEWEMPL